VSRSPEVLAAARDMLTKRVSPYVLAHSEATAAAAVTLALRHGVDATDAELAGLLHDYARDMTGDDLLTAAADLGVPVLEFEREHPLLLHARVGAALLRRDLPGAGEAVLSAIEVHTVGGVPMSDLDRVVYLADMVATGRDYEGVEPLRAVCREASLSECFRVGYGRTVRHVLASGRPLHPISAAVGAQIEKETGRALFDPPEVAA
jgi:predicted HD superfamily hydrolase involved in NAD metabolism